MPYYGLQLELTPNYDERTRLTAVMALRLEAHRRSSPAGPLSSSSSSAPSPRATSSIARGKPVWLRDLVHHIQPWLHSLASNHVGEKPIVTGMRLMCWLIAS
jgi:GPH family glycoside/pentoside/hexuronide:cation symporter